jgi:hypothetical protein
MGYEEKGWRIILKWILKKWAVKEWTGLLSIGHNDGLLRTNNEFLVP